MNAVYEIKKDCQRFQGRLTVTRPFLRLFPIEKKKKKNRKTHQKKKHQHILNEKSILKTEKSHLMFFKLKS